MKALIIFVVAVAMAFWIYKQNADINDLKASLADEQAKSAQLQTDLDAAKKEAEASAAKAAQPVYRSPLSSVAPTPVPTSSRDWIWNKKTPLDDPAK